jgi:anti-sigma regulatory factor (Ser/Thr protein kinase)
VTTTVSEAHKVRIRTEGDAAEAARLARELGLRHGLSANEAVQVATAVSEVASNQLRHALDGGTVTVSRSPEGVRVEAIDVGPGIADVDVALRDGWSSDGGLGLGLPGARRLMDRFEIASAPGAGTVVRMDKLVEPDPGPLAEWRVSGRGRGGEAVTESTDTRLLLGVMHTSAALIARADPLWASEHLVAALEGGRGVIAHLSGRDGSLWWLCRGRAFGILLRGHGEQRRVAATAPTQRVAEVGVLRDDVLLLATGEPDLERKRPDDLAVMATEAARETGGVALAIRVLRGRYERPHRRGS